MAAHIISMVNESVLAIVVTIHMFDSLTVGTSTLTLFSAFNSSLFGQRLFWSYQLLCGKNNRFHRDFHSANTENNMKMMHIEEKFWVLELQRKLQERKTGRLNGAALWYSSFLQNTSKMVSKLWIHKFSPVS